jgi:hypothetical protein
MLRPLLIAALLLPSATLAQDAATPEAEAEPEVVTRPGVAEGAEAPLPSDDLAECAALFAVVSTRATQRIQRERLEAAASAWFAKAGDVAIAEGNLPEAEVWGEKVAAWAGQISSVDSLDRHRDWVDYCAVVGGQHGMAAEDLGG